MGSKRRNKKLANTIVDLSVEKVNWIFIYNNSVSSISERLAIHSFV